MEEPDDDCELKLPKMRSLIIMICTNVLLQVRRLWRRLMAISPSNPPHRQHSSSLSPLAANMPSTSVAARHFPDSSSVSRPSFPG